MSQPEGGASNALKGKPHPRSPGEVSPHVETPEGREKDAHVKLPSSPDSHQQLSVGEVHQETVPDSEGNGLQPVLRQDSHCRVLEADERVSDCRKGKEAGQGETQADLPQENGATLQDSWSTGDVTIKQEVEEEKGTLKTKGNEDEKEGRKHRVKWSYLCEVVLPTRAADGSADVCSSTDNGEDKKDAVFHICSVANENSALKTLGSPPAQLNNNDKKDDVTVIPALQKTDTVADRNRKSSESVSGSEGSMDVKEENIIIKSSYSQEASPESNNELELRLNTNLRSSEKSSSKSASFLTYIFGKNFSDRVTPRQLQETSIKDEKDSVQSIQFSLPWKRPPEKRSQAENRMSFGSEVDPPLESLKSTLPESVEGSIHENNAESSSLLMLGFLNTPSGSVAAEQPVAGSERSFQGKLSESEGSSSMPAAVQRSLGRRKQTNPRQRPAKGQVRVDVPQWDTKEESIVQSEETLKHVSDADLQVNKKDKDHRSENSHTQNPGTTYVDTDIKFVCPNTLTGKQTEGKEFSLSQTHFDAVNNSTPGFIVPVLKSSSFQPKHPYPLFSPAPCLVQRLKSATSDLTQMTFCLQSSLGRNSEAKQAEDSGLLSENKTSHSDNFNVPSTPFINVQTSWGISQSTTTSSLSTKTFSDVMKFSHQWADQKTEVTQISQTEPAKSSPSPQDDVSSHDSTMASSSADVLRMADMSGTDYSSSTLCLQPLTESRAQGDAYHIFGFQRGYEKVEAASEPAVQLAVQTAGDSSQMKVSGSNSQCTQEDKTLPVEAKLSDAEPIDHGLSHETASISGLASASKSSSKRKSQSKTRLTSHQAMTKKDAQRQTDFTSSALADGFSQEVINSHPLLQPVACKGTAREKHANARGRKRSFTDVSKMQLIVKTEDEATLFHNTPAATSPGRREKSLNTIPSKQHKSVQEARAGQRMEPVLKESPPSKQFEPSTKSALASEQRGKGTASIHPVQQTEEKAAGKTAFSIVSAVSNLLQSLTAKTTDTPKDTPQTGQSFPAVATLTHIVSEIQRKDTAACKNASTEENSKFSRSQGKKKVLEDGDAQPPVQGPPHASTLPNKQIGGHIGDKEVTSNQTSHFKVGIEKGVKPKRSNKSTNKTGRGGVMSPLEKQGAKLPVSHKPSSPSFPANNVLSVPSIPIPFGNFSFLPLQLLAPNIQMFTSHVPRSSNGNAGQILMPAGSSAGKADDSSFSTPKEQSAQGTSHGEPQSVPHRNAEAELEGSSLDGSPATANVSYSQAPLLGLPPGGSGIPVFFLLPHSQILALGPTASGGTARNLRCRQETVPLDKSSLTPSTARRQTQRPKKPKLQPKKKCIINSRSPLPTKQIVTQPELQSRLHTIPHGQLSSAIHPFPKMTEDAGLSDQCEVTSSTWADDVTEGYADGTSSERQASPVPQPLLADVREMTQMQGQFITTQNSGTHLSSTACSGNQSGGSGSKSPPMSEDTKNNQFPSQSSEEIKLESLKHAENLASRFENNYGEVSKNSVEKRSEQCFPTATERLFPYLLQSNFLQKDERGDSRKPTRQKRSVPHRYRTAARDEELSELFDFSECENDISDDEWKPGKNDTDINSSSEIETDADCSWDLDDKSSKASKKTHKKILVGKRRSRRSGTLGEQKSHLVQILQECDNASGCQPLMQMTSVLKLHGSVTSTGGPFCVSRNETSTSNSSACYSNSTDLDSVDIGLQGQMSAMNAETDRKDLNATVGVAQVHHPKSNRRRRRVPYTKEELTCRECHKVFVNIYRLRRHEGSHREDRPHVCDICGKGFKQSGHRNEHRLTHDTVGRRSFLCNHCGVIISSRSSFRYHMMSHEQLFSTASANKNQPIACSTKTVCSPRAPPQNLSSDVATVSLEQGRQPEPEEAMESNSSSSAYTAYDCPHCSDRFATAQSLNSHLESHPEVALRCHVQPFMCEKCGRSFTYRHNLEKHQLLHLKPVKYADLYRRKVQEHIASGKPHFTCDTCGKVYLRKETLAKHCKTHLGIKPFQCHVCCKRFTQKIHLTVHSRLHTGIRPFQCRTCRCCFLDSTALARHVERDLCRQEGFNFNIGKRGRRPFPLTLEGDKNQEERKRAVTTSVLHCSLCKWRGKRQGNLANHMRRVHTSTTPAVISDLPGSPQKMTLSDPGSAVPEETRIHDLLTAGVSHEACESAESTTQPVHDAVKAENADTSSLATTPDTKLNTQSTSVGTTASPSEAANEHEGSTQSKHPSPAICMTAELGASETPAQIMQRKDPSPAVCIPTKMAASEAPAQTLKRTPRKRREGPEDILSAAKGRTGAAPSGETVSQTKVRASPRQVVKRTASSAGLSDDETVSNPKAKQTIPCEEAAGQRPATVNYILHPAAELRTLPQEALSDSVTSASPKPERASIEAANKATGQSPPKQIRSPRQAVKREVSSGEGLLDPESRTSPRIKNSLIQTCEENTSNRNDSSPSTRNVKAENVALSGEPGRGADSTAVSHGSRDTDDKAKTEEPKTPRSCRRAVGKKEPSLHSSPAGAPKRKLGKGETVKLRPPRVSEFHCNDCGVKFLQISHLNRHLREHLTPRPPARVLRNCPVGKAGDESEPTPTRGGRSFKCEICGKAFYIRSQLNRHHKQSCSLPSDKIRHKCA